MKLNDKYPRLKKEIEFIARHDDASWTDVTGLLGDAKKYIDAELEAAGKRRAEAQAAKEKAASEKEKVTITTQDVGEIRL